MYPNNHSPFTPGANMSNMNPSNYPNYPSPYGTMQRPFHPGSPANAVNPASPASPARNIMTPREGVVGQATDLLHRRAYRSGGSSSGTATPPHNVTASTASMYPGSVSSLQSHHKVDETMCRLEALRAAERENHEEKLRLRTLKEEQDARHQETLAELLRLFTPFSQMGAAATPAATPQPNAFATLSGIDTLKHSLHPKVGSPRMVDDVFSDVLHSHMGGGPVQQRQEQRGLGTEHWRHIFQLFYEKHNPLKVREVDAILAAARGREAVVYSEMQRKYVPQCDPEVLIATSLPAPPEEPSEAEKGAEEATVAAVVAVVSSAVEKEKEQEQEKEGEAEAEAEASPSPPPPPEALSPLSPQSSAPSPPAASPEGSPSSPSPSRRAAFAMFEG